MKKVSETLVFNGQWVAVHELVYRNKKGQDITWETVVRKKSTVGVVVIARLVPSKRFILVKQHRPAVDGYVLGFPAGLAFDDPNQALIELKEETGYIGKISAVSPVLKTGASLINDNGRIVCVEVDETNSANQNPVQELEAAEDIEVCLVEPPAMLEFLTRQHQQGVHISANLWYLFGLQDFA